MGVYNTTTIYVDLIYMPYINESLVIQTSVAALLVIFGVVLKNSFQQMGTPNHPIGTPLGMLFFTAGWIYTAYILSVGKPNKLLFIIPSIGVLVSAMLMRIYMDKKKTPHMILPIVFSASWILLGYGVGNHLHGNTQYIGLLASAFVLISMMLALPFQRTKCVVDGPGMPLFVIAWGIIVYLNGLNRR